MTDEEERKLDKVVSSVAKIETALLGMNGHGGLLNDFEEHCEDSATKFDKLAEDYYAFKRLCFIIFGVLLGTGVLGGGGYWIYEVISH